MSNMQRLASLLLVIARHPVTQAIARHAIRVGTAELVRAVNRGTRRTKIPTSL